MSEARAEQARREMEAALRHHESRVVADVERIRIDRVRIAVEDRRWRRQQVLAQAAAKKWTRT
jgi:hypothetical protein